MVETTLKSTTLKSAPSSDLEVASIRRSAGRADHGAEPRSSAGATSVLARPAPINILIVDDEPRNLAVLEAILEGPRYRLVHAGSAEQALLALLVDEFAVLILDIRMPGVSGLELAQIIKERKKTANVPIIFLTAYYNDDKHAIEGYDAGAVDYLLKPVNPAILRSKVGMFAELHRKQRAVEEANRALLAEVLSRRHAEEQLRELNDTLEQRVADRTALLHASTQRLRAIYDGTFEFMWLLAPDGSLLEANRSALEFARCDLTSVAGRPFWDTPWFKFTPGAGDTVREAAARAAAGETQRFEMQLHGPASEARTIDISFRPLHDERGRVILIVPAGLDITSRVLAEQATNRLAAVVESSDDAILSKDLNGIIATFNQAAEQLFGYKAEEVIGKPVTVLFPVDRQHEGPELLARIRRGERIHHFETVRRCKDGTLLDISLTISPIKDAQGKIIGASKIARDITQRKLAEAKIHESERRFREMIAELPAAVFTVDGEGRLTHYNRAGLDLAGRIPLETDRWCIGWRLYNVDGSVLPHEESHMAVAIKTGVSLQGAEMVIERPDGARKLVTSYPTVMRDEKERIVGGLNILFDITERKRNEERITLLLNEVDHRSKNILSVVQAIAKQTAISTPDEFLKRFSTRLQTLAASHDLLVRSRWQGVEMSDLMHAQLAHFAPLIGNRIRLDGPSFQLSASAAQTLGMIVHELATNAAKYGALSNDSGQVDVCWHAPTDVFTITWTERGGPSVVMPNRRGFGSIVVKTMAESSFDGDVDLDFTPAGLRWRATCPAANVLDKSAHWSDNTIGSTGCQR
jgi:PAS domain S-box-containing protein